MSRRRVRSSGDEPTGPRSLGAIELVADPDRPRAWTLVVEGTPQSHVDLDDPTSLEFEYVRWLGHVADLTPSSQPGADRGGPLGVLHLGGGAWTLARYLASTRPGSRQRVVEIDAALAGFVRDRLPLGDLAGIRVRIGDAREVLASLTPASVDLVVVDVFAGARIPAHVTSLEFVRAAARVLRPGGTYAANLADGPPLAFARGQAATLRAAFASIALVGSPYVLRGRGFGNLLLVGVRPLPLDSMVDVDAPAPTTMRADDAERWLDLGRLTASDPFRARVVTGTELVRFIAGAPVVTDATAVPSPPPPTFL